jgi:hypothetical protein
VPEADAARKTGTASETAHAKTEATQRMADDKNYQQALLAAESVQFEPGRASVFLQRYLNQHPNGYHAKEARDLLAVGLAERADDFAFTAARRRAELVGTDHEEAIHAYKQYLERFPKGRNTTTAQDEIRALEDKGQERDYQEIAALFERGRPGEAAAAGLKFLERAPKGRRIPDMVNLLETHSPWRVRLISAALEHKYTEGDQPFQILRSPTQVGARLAVIDVEFEATSATPGTLEDRLERVQSLLPFAASEYLRGEGRFGLFGKHHEDVGSDGTETRLFLAKPARLFLSNQVHLVLADGRKLSPEFTSDLGGGGWTYTNDTSGFRFLPRGDESRAVLRFVRLAGITAALVQPQKQAKATFIYSVPPNTARATLRFYGWPPLDILFAK